MSNIRHTNENFVISDDVTLSRSVFTFGATAREAQDSTLDVSEKFLQDLVEACASGIAMLDEGGVVKYASRAWRMFEQNWFGSREQNQLMHYFTLLRKEPEDHSQQPTEPSSLADDIRTLLNNSATDIQGRYSYAGLTASHSLLVHAARLELPNSRFTILISHDDLIPKEALRKSEQRLNQLLETTRIVAWEADPETWQLTYVSAQAREFLGYPILVWYQPDFLVSNIHPEDRHVLRTCKEKSRTADSFEVSFRLLARDGRSVWIHNLVSVTRDGSRTAGLHGFMIDVTEQRRVQEVLRDLGSRLIAAQEEERRRIARELHDDLNQRLALLSMELEQLHSGGNPTSYPNEQFQIFQGHIDEIAADIHRLSYRLHPSKLDHLGLAPAVESLCRELSSDKLTVHYRQTGFPAELSQDVTLCLFRIAQEALRNCIKHSRAELALLTLEKLDNEIRLSVVDDGCGFETNSSTLQQGLGFTSMRERLRLVDGEIEIRSRPSQGTTIQVSVPLTRSH